MATLKGLESIVSELRGQRTNLQNQLKHVDAALSALGALNGSQPSTKRTMSPAARRKISMAQKARWAKRNAPNSSVARRPRTLSAEARRKIAVAQRARWAKVKAAQKKAA